MRAAPRCPGAFSRSSIGPTAPEVRSDPQGRSHGDDDTGQQRQPPRRAVTHRPAAPTAKCLISAGRPARATAQRVATQTEAPQVSSLPLPQIRWRRTATAMTLLAVARCGGPAGTDAQRLSAFARAHLGATLRGRLRCHHRCRSRHHSRPPSPAQADHRAAREPQLNWSYACWSRTALACVLTACLNVPPAAGR